MTDSKRLVVNLSEALYNELDETLNKKCKKRSEFFREAIVLYIEEKKKLSEIDELAKGYLEMAQLNMELAEIGFIRDMIELKEYEARLSESDLPNDDSSEKRRYILC
jgi:CopG family transcriptional regulator/antitoxin EndoAI